MQSKFEFVLTCQIDQTIEIFSKNLKSLGSLSFPRPIHRYFLGDTHTEVQLEYPPKSRYRKSAQLKITLTFSQPLDNFKDRNQIYFALEMILRILEQS